MDYKQLFYYISGDFSRKRIQNIFKIIIIDSDDEEDFRGALGNALKDRNNSAMF